MFSSALEMTKTIYAINDRSHLYCYSLLLLSHREFVWWTMIIWSGIKQKFEIFQVVHCEFMSTVIGNVNSVSKIFVYQPTCFYEKWLSCKLYHVLSSLRVVAPRAQKWLNTFIKLNLNLICTKWFINLSDIKNIKFQIYIFCLNLSQLCPINFKSI